LTVAASFLFLTPRAGLLVALGVVPIAALAVGGRRTDRARRALGLAPPAGGDRSRRVAAILLFAALLALAAMQPAVRTETPRHERTDAEAFVVLDISRSMAATPSATGPTRLQRAKRIALTLATQFGDIPVGVATFTDRVLPDLFPTSDHAAYDSAVSAVTVEDPPPSETSTVATNLGALTQIATQGYFPRSARKRAVIVITDGESAPFDPRGVAGSFSANGIRLALVRVGDGSDRVRRPNGSPEANFRPDPRGARVAIGELAAAAKAPTGESAATALARALGPGPTSIVGLEPHTRTLAPLPALLALLPLAFLLAKTLSPRLLRRVTFWHEVASSRRTGK
jgi:von Willebrand factor type A domain